MRKRRIKKIALLLVALGVIGGAASLSASRGDAHVYAPAAHRDSGGHY